MRKVLYILGQLSDSDVGWLARSGKRMKVLKGTQLVQLGVSLSKLYITLDGTVFVRDGGVRSAAGAAR